MKVLQDLEELALHLREIGATGLKLLLDGFGYPDGFCAIASLGLVFPETSEGGQNVVPVLGGWRVDAEGGQGSVKFGEEGEHLLIVQGAFHLAPAGG